MGYIEGGSSLLAGLATPEQSFADYYADAYSAMSQETKKAEQIGAGILGIAGTAIGGPIGGMIGASIGGVAGRFFGGRAAAKKAERALAQKRRKWAMLNNNEVQMPSIEEYGWIV